MRSMSRPATTHTARRVKSPTEHPATTAPTTVMWTSSEKSDGFWVVTPDLIGGPPALKRGLRKRGSPFRGDDEGNGHAHRDPHRDRQLRPDRSPRRCLLGRTDRALDREFPVRATRADAAGDR